MSCHVYVNKLSEWHKRVYFSGRFSSHVLIKSKFDSDDFSFEPVLEIKNRMFWTGQHSGA